MKQEKKRFPAAAHFDTRQRSALDRRSGEDRRKVYSLDYFLDGGIERRRGDERRQLGERRSDWKRVGRWYSVYCNSEYYEYLKPQTPNLEPAI